MNASLFEGVRVIDFTNNIAGPSIGAMLSEFGADVIKVEKPVFGDDSRSWGKSSHLGGNPLDGGFNTYNNGKKSVVLDLKDPRGLKIAKELLAEADVLLESYRPGIMAKMGLGYDDVKKINPSIVYASISCFGQEGPYSELGGYDVIAQAASGIMDLTGEPNGDPTKIGVEIGDFTGGITGWGAVCAALFYRERTGKGQHIDISLTRILTWMSFRNKETVTRSGNMHDYLSPYGLFNRKAGESVIIATINQNLWERLCAVLEKPELITDPKYATNPARVANKEELAGIIEDWLRAQPTIEAACEKLSTSGVPYSKVYTQKDVRNDPHYLACNWMVDLPLPQETIEENGVETKRIVGMPVKFSDAEPVYRIAPTLGENNHEVLEALGYSAEEIDSMEHEWREKVLAKLKK